MDLRAILLTVIIILSTSIFTTLIYLIIDKKIRKMRQETSFDLQEKIMLNTASLEKLRNLLEGFKQFETLKELPDMEVVIDDTPKKRGRPKGSKNKPKDEKPENGPVDKEVQS